ncbi:hypothetical protein GCM10010449_42530 [Streptomyces rectiviolaceus]|uniref:Uncharacterized protein n=1 Tax=Streptomyces rectiviolaceus TaxID=332591 RepID=A0ABP6MJZ4_9ACTN
MALPRPAELAFTVCLRVREEPVGEAPLFQGAHRPLLDEARAGPLFDELPGLRLQDHAVDGSGSQDVGDGEPRRSGSYDDDAGAPSRRGGLRS